jgi:hypothetical protein
MMGRSVMTHNDACYNIYLPCEVEDEFQWEMFVDDCVYRLRDVAESFCDIRDYDNWHQRECKEIVDNNLAFVTISHYVSVASLSFIVRRKKYIHEKPKENLAYSWLGQMKPQFRKAFPERLAKKGTFSNGNSVYEKVNKGGDDRECERV